MRRAALLLLLSGVAYAEPAPAELIRHDVDEVLTLLRDAELAKPERRELRRTRLRAVADRVFDWAEMARRSLGPPWRTIDAAQQRRFTQLFTDRVADSYLNDMDLFAGDESVKVLGSETVGDDTRVSTLLITHSRERITIDYTLHRTPAGWRVYDFAIEGVSLVAHYRAMFARYLTNHDFNQLLDKLPRTRAPAS